MKKLQNYIDGKFLDPLCGQFIDNIEPATGKVYSYIPDSDEQDVAIAVTAAEKAFPVWSKMSTEERSQILVRLSEGIQNRILSTIDAADSLLEEYSRNLISTDEFRKAL